MHNVTTASKGIRKIHTAQIMMVLSVIFATVLTVIVALTGELNDTSTFLKIVMIALVIAVVVVSILYTVLTIIGCCQAIRGSIYFLLALLLVIVKLLTFLTSYEGLMQLIKISVPESLITNAALIDSVVSVLIVLFIVAGTCSILKNASLKSLCSKGWGTLIIFVIAFGIQIVADHVTAVSDFINKNTTISLIALVVILVLKLVAFFSYMSFLGKAADNL